MADVCADFGQENSITFNEKKSVCIKFGSDSQKPDIVINGKALQWESKVKHVGNVLNPSLHDKNEIQLKRQEFFQQVNKLLADSQKYVQWDIIAHLFSKYCNSFYGSHMWDLRSLHLQALYRSWNRAVRIVLQLPFDSHHYLLPLLLDTPSLEVQLMCRFVTVYKTIYHN